MPRDRIRVGIIKTYQEIAHTRSPIYECQKTTNPKPKFFLPHSLISLGPHLIYFNLITLIFKLKSRQPPQRPPDVPVERNSRRPVCVFGPTISIIVVRLSFSRSVTISGQNMQPARWQIEP